MFSYSAKELSPTKQAQALMSVSLENEELVEAAVNGNEEPWRNALVNANISGLSRSIIPVLDCYFTQTNTTDLRRYNGNDPDGWTALCNISEADFNALPPEAKMFDENIIAATVMYNAGYNVVKQMILPKLVSLYSQVYTTLGNHEPEAADNLFKAVNELDGYFDEYVNSEQSYNLTALDSSVPQVNHEKFKEIMKVMANAYMENPNLNDDMLDFMQQIQTAIASAITIAKYLNDNDQNEVGAYKTTLIRMAKIVQATNIFLSGYTVARIANMNKRAKCFC